MRIVVAEDVSEDDGLDLFSLHSVCRYLIQLFFFQCGKEALHTSVDIAMSSAAEALNEPICYKFPAEGVACVLAATVTVENTSFQSTVLLTQLFYGVYAEFLHKFESKRIETEEGDILRIDRNGKITRSQFEPKLYRSKYMSWYDYSPYYNMHEEILLAYCGCYGVDSSDVELLLDYGYTCDEIEDMLADQSLLCEALKDVKYLYGEDIYESCYGGSF